jgi:hypothetical protein
MAHEGVANRPFLSQGLTFLPLRNWLSGSEGKDGQVFYLFAIIIAIGVVVLGRRIPGSQG